MGEGKRVQKKDITARTTVKAVITGYIAYGILVGFIFSSLGIVINWFVNQLNVANYRTLSITMSLLGALLIYSIFHGVCKISIYDVFNNCKTSKDGIEKITTRLNLFVLLCVAASVILTVFMLTVEFNMQRKAILIASYQYRTVHSEQFAEELTNKMINNFEEQSTNTIISTTILELGVIVTCFSIIPYQKKMIERYNEV